MNIKEELAQEMEITCQNFHHLLDSVPEAFYHHPSSNPAWTIGDVLNHITLGPSALRFEIWMIRHARWLFQIMMNDLTATIFNQINKLFSRRPKRITRQTLGNAYETGHAGLMFSLKRISEHEFQKSIIYPESFVEELTGEVSIERLFRYVKQHFDLHAEQIKNAIKESQ
ncbi:MAG TPA: hypothetical protein VLA72_23070 [Anaerolineales bacterium]|nr:hypothetical protein [Anaerolineales bacterium]